MTANTAYPTAHALRVTPAAPARGARVARGRGCVWGAGALALALLASPGAAQAVAVPSGRDVTLTDVLIDQTTGEDWVHFRFVAHGLTEDGDRDAAMRDMDHLCQSLALPYLETHALNPARVVIAWSDRKVEFGASDPEAVQFFETYRPENARCIWEGF